jgi:hypothetical protein
MNRTAYLKKSSKSKRSPRVRGDISKASDEFGKGELGIAKTLSKARAIAVRKRAG